MNVLILGAGQVGLGVARHLKNRNIDVTIVEKSPELVFNIRNFFDINIIQGNALDAEVLKNANAENSTHLIATMSDDEQNILVCKLASALFNIGNKIARLKSHPFLKNSMSDSFIKENFDIDLLIHPELEVAKYIADIASVNGAFDVIKFDYAIIVGLKCKDNTEILNTTLKHFPNITDLRLFILTITRGETTIFPLADDLLLPGDDVYLIIAADDFEKVMILFGYPPTHRQNFLIIGGERMGSLVVQTIFEKNSGAQITLLEKSKDRAEEISQQYPDITTILGDASDYDLLSNLSASADTAIVLTDCDKTNALSSLLLKQLKVKRILTLEKSRNYDSLLQTSFGCSVVDPITVTAENIIYKTCTRNIISAVRLKNSPAYIIEAIINESCYYLGEKIESLCKKNDITPIFVIRNNKIVSAKKDVELQLNDQIMMIVPEDKISSTEQIFSNYFSSD
ncbi:MAG: Trk system potassium transporter TrkA [Holosporaceae bacterium]|jgi:trk system potassium uptake protein TrkA|nr:Trk system potassium transporter TrkA [Holosporaceae bacterium]